jgi:hypothetical protein
MVQIVCEAIMDFIDDSECKNCDHNAGQITLDHYVGGCPYRDHETTEEEIERIVNDEPLYIVPCGSKKIWSKNPNLGEVPANRVYIGAYTRNMIKYMEKKGAFYIIFSGVYGLIKPDTLLNDYDSGGKLRIPFTQLEEQVKENRWDCFRIITLCNKEFNQHLKRLFDRLEYFYPPGLFLGQRQSYLKEKMEA